MNKMRRLLSYLVARESQTMNQALEAVNMACVAMMWSRLNNWSVKVERGDLQQGGATYTNMARRITLINDETKEEFIEIFKGSKCSDKAEAWFEVKTNGAFGSVAETRWMWL